MKVLGVLSTSGMSKFTIRADHGEDFKENTFLYVGGEKYKVFESWKSGKNILDPIYTVIAKHKPQLTKFNYDLTDFVFEVVDIERIDQLTISINKHHGHSIVTLETPEECLKEFLLLKVLRGEANGNQEFYELRY